MYSSSMVNQSRGDNRLLATALLAISAGAFVGVALNFVTSAAPAQSLYTAPVLTSAPTAVTKPAYMQPSRRGIPSLGMEPYEVAELEYLAEQEAQPYTMYVAEDVQTAASTPMSLPALGAVLLAALGAVFYGVKRSMGTNSTETQQWATMGLSASYGAQARRATRLAARGGDDFDRNLLRGSDWGGGGQGPAAPGGAAEGGLPRSMDDLENPTDNSGFNQAGGFGWSDGEQGYDHISRRMRLRNDEKIQQVEAEKKELGQKVMQEVTARREQRVLPKDEDGPEGLLQYLLETVTDDLAFEITRMRPSLNADFDAHLDGLIEAELAAQDVIEPGEGEAPPSMHRNYEVLKALIQITFAKIDATTEFLTAPIDRLKKLLSSKDKKAMILEMAGNNEIDEELLVLIKTNQTDAQTAGADQVAEFLGKIHDECARFVMSS